MFLWRSTMTQTPNPYAPPSAPSNNTRCDCPVCGNYVGFWRFHLPFGYCHQCGNYLTIRNWAIPKWFTWFYGKLPSVVVVLGIAFYRPLFLTPSNLWYFYLFVVFYLVASELVERLTGRLVPATCWGFSAFRDDDRLKPSSLV